METAADIEQIIKHHVEPFLLEKELYLVNIRVSPGKRIEVMADNDKGITISECAEISRFLENLPELESIFEHHVLEVSSPGVDEPLVLLRQYHKNIGRRISLTLPEGNLLEGYLELVNADFVVLKTYTQVKNIRKDEKIVEVPFSDIKKAVIQVKFK